jgi:hypothetical protein
MCILRGIVDVVVDDDGVVWLSFCFFRIVAAPCSVSCCLSFIFYPVLILFSLFFGLSFQATNEVSERRGSKLHLEDHNKGREGKVC